jgi:hypothetical protein
MLSAMHQALACVQACMHVYALQGAVLCRDAMHGFVGVNMFMRGIASCLLG